MQIVVSNNLRITGLLTASPLKLAIQDALTMPNPEYYKKKAKRISTWGIPKTLQLYNIDQYVIVTGRGFLAELEQVLIAHNVNPKEVITTQYNEGMAADFGEWAGPPPRDYQAPAIDAILADNGTLVSPAGSGKTYMGMNYIAKCGRCALWLTHTSDLMRQAKENAEKYLSGVGEVGIIGEGVTKWGSGKLIVAMAQTLGQNEKLVEQLNQVVGTLVIDEAHHFPAPLFIDIANQFKAKHFVGLTATPERKDGLERFLYVGIGPIRHEVPRTALNDLGQLIIPEVRFIYTNFDYEPASVINAATGAVDAGGEDLDYADLLKNLIADTGRLDMVARNVLDNAPGNYSIVLTESVRYCFYIKNRVEKMAREKGFKVPRIAVVHGGLTQYNWRVVKNQRAALQRVEAGTASEWRYNDTKERYEVRVRNYTDAEMEDFKCTPKQRREIIQQMRDKNLDIIIATQLAREGLDIPHLNIEHMAMPKRGDTSGNRKDGSAVEQEVGRIQRPDPTNKGKKAILFDYVDSKVGVFNDQYYSRRKVYKRLGMAVPKKPRTVRDDVDAFLGSELYF